MVINGKALAEQARQEIQEISVQELATQLSRQPIIIDIRELSELTLGLLPGAIHISRGILEMQLTSHPAVVHQDNPLLALAQQPIYLYCQSGARSALAAQSLLKMGLSQVYSLNGGFIAWKNAGLSPVKINV